METSSLPRSAALELPVTRAARTDAVVLAGIVVVSWILYALSPVTTSTDSGWAFHIAASILQQHNIDLDEYRGIINLDVDYLMRLIDGHIYSYYPIATPLFIIPAVWLIIVQNWLTYVNPFLPSSYQLFERLSMPAVFFEGFAGTLISPARGQFIFSSLFLFSIYGGYLRLRGQCSLANPDRYLAAIVVAHWITVALFQDWGGAWSVGRRYFVDVIPQQVYFLIPVLRADVLAMRAVRRGLVATVLISTLIQLHCSASIYPFMWNGKPVAMVSAPQRKWDWGDLQFLRGFCPSNPLEGKAAACWFQAHD